MNGSKVSAAVQSAQPQRGEAAARKSRPGMRPIPVGRDAQRYAAAILEVLAGVRTPTEAAAMLSLSLPRYYLWEQRALEGLVRACEPRPKGKRASERHKIAVLEKEVAGLRQDCARQQALVRASQRTLGLAVASAPVARPAAGTQRSAGGKDGAKAAGTVAGKAKRKRRPVARALKAVAALQAAPSPSESPADSSSANLAEMVQRSVPDNVLQAAAEAGAVTALTEA